MGYFPNASIHEDYKCRYCYGCQHWVFDAETQTDGCPVMDMHESYNYEECNNDDSALHKWMIPKINDEHGPRNGKCLHFRVADGEVEKRDKVIEAAKKLTTNALVRGRESTEESVWQLYVDDVDNLDAALAELDKEVE